MKHQGEELNKKYQGLNIQTIEIPTSLNILQINLVLSVVAWGVSLYIWLGLIEKNT